jgi:similar to stage IV sporulation protein
MKANLANFFNGHVLIIVTGTTFEELINRLLEARISIWDISRLGTNRGQFSIGLADFFHLKPFLRQTNCRIRVTQRRGFPFMLDKLEKRKWFAIGAVISVIAIYISTSLVWQINIEGNEQISNQELIRVAAAEGLRPLQWKFRLPPANELSARMSQQLPDAAWIGIEIQGTVVTLRVVESTIPEQKALRSPRHLIAITDGVITHIVAERGNPMVQVNQRVKKGELLISGIIGTVDNPKIVVAEGQIRGMVWYEYQIKVPLILEHIDLTGANQSKRFITIASRALQVSGYRDNDFLHSQKKLIFKQLQLGPWRLPIGWMNEISYEARVVQEQQNPAQAKRMGLENARKELIGKLGSSAEIKEEIILHERLQSGKVELSVLYAIEIDFAEERPIVE